MLLGAKPEEPVPLVGVLAFKSAHESEPSGAEEALGVFHRETMEPIKQHLPYTARVFNQAISMHHLEDDLAASHIDQAASPG